jgi:hypothetical protein
VGDAAGGLAIDGLAVFLDLDGQIQYLFDGEQGDPLLNFAGLKS